MENDVDVNPLHVGGEQIRSADEAFHLLKASREKPATEAPASVPESLPVETPAEEPAAQETEPSEATTEVVEAAPEEPPIDPPASWNKEAKDAFKALPRHLQVTVSERERAREAATNRAMNESAESRKAINAEREALRTQAQHYEQQLRQFIPMLQNQLQGEFADIKTLADAQSLARTDPARYIQWDAAQRALAGATADAQRIAQENRERAIKAHNETVQAESAKLREKLPELADEEAYSKFASDLGKYLRTEGFSQDEIAQLTDHRTAIVARKAMLYDAAQAAKAKAAEIKVPKVQVPGAGSSTAQAAADARAARVNRAIKSGDLRGIVEAYRS